MIEHNGDVCHSGLPGSGVYMTVTPEEGADATRLYRPQFLSSTIRLNGGPAIDIDRVWGGTIRNTTIQDNAAWTAMSLFAASQWTIEDNHISHPSAHQVAHPGHPECWSGPDGIHPSAIALCRPDHGAGLQVQENVFQRNTLTSWYGVLSIGNTYNNAAYVPTNNVFINNTISISATLNGCADAGQNTWTANTCGSNGVVAFDSRCQSTIARSQTAAWERGERVNAAAVTPFINAFDAARKGGEYRQGDRIPAGVVIATSFGPDDSYIWRTLPVRPLIHYHSYGIFETIGVYTAVYPGACMTLDAP